MSKRIVDEMCGKETADRANASRGHKVHGDFCEFDDKGNIEKVRCRFCGIQIAGWYDASVKARQVDGGPVVHEVRQRFGRFSNFANVALVLESGSQYDPNMCKECAAKVNFDDPAVAEACFCADIESWARGYKASGKSAEAFQKEQAEVVRQKVKGRR